MQPSLVQRLRDSVTQCRALDRSQLLEEAAAEIERLRAVMEPMPKEKRAEVSEGHQQPTLTDAEQEAVEQAIDAANGMGQAEPWTMRTLRGLLDRLK